MPRAPGTNIAADGGQRELRESLAPRRSTFQLKLIEVNLALGMRGETGA